MSTEPSHLERILDRQASLWEMRRRLSTERDAEERQALSHLPEGPWITISKQLGSGGVELAARVAQRLGWQVFDKQILEAIARETHTRERILSRLDGRAVGVLEDYLSHLLVPGDPGQVAYLQQVVRVVWTLAREGHAVLVGRGANWILNPRYGLRIRVVAPFETRASWVSQAEGLDLAAARRRVEEDEAAVAKFTRKVFRRDIDDPLGYDLVLNLGTVDLETAAGIVLTAMPGKLGSVQ